MDSAPSKWQGNDMGNTFSPQVAKEGAMTKFQYILTASGNVSLPQLNLMLFAKTDEQAIELSQSHAQALSKAGYFRFWLTGSTTDALGSLAGEHLHRQLGELSVKTPEPVASFTAAK